MPISPMSRNRTGSSPFLVKAAECPVVGFMAGVIWTEFTFGKRRTGRRYRRVGIKNEWDRLDSETRTWLLENPGALTVPPAMSAKIGKDAHGEIGYDPNGQVVLSRDDHDFIREKAEAAGTIRVPPGTEYRFFDTAPVPVIGGTPSETPAAAWPDDVQ